MARNYNPDENSSDENKNSNDDNFGLPEIEYQPINRREGVASSSEPASSSPQTSNSMEREETTQNESTSNYYEEEEENNSPWPKILAIAAILFLVAIGFWYFGMYRPKQQLAEKERMERESAEKQRLADLEESRRAEAERRRADSLAALNPAATPGAIDTLSERTGRYYVIIASSVDGDLILDYAKKLAPKGLSPKLIPPHGKVKFYRLAIDDGDSFAAAQTRADQVKGEYADGAWVVKY